MKTYFEDRYGGCYSGFGYIVIENPEKYLAAEEVKIFNECLQDGDEFYSSWGIDESTIVSEENTRFEAVDRSIRGADVYAGWAKDLLEAISWVHGKDELPDNDEINLISY